MVDPYSSLVALEEAEEDLAVVVEVALEASVEEDLVVVAPEENGNKDIYGKALNIEGFLF